jgi:hypothetical protein
MVYDSGVNQHSSGATRPQRLANLNVTRLRVSDQTQRSLKRVWPSASFAAYPGIVQIVRAPASVGSYTVPTVNVANAILILPAELADAGLKQQERY